MVQENLFCLLDYETFSEADLKRVGAWEYSLHPSTEIICVGFRFGTKEEIKKKATIKWAPRLEHTAPAFPFFLKILRDPRYKLVAHNAFFEQAITRNVFAKRLMPSKPELQAIPVERWDCTAARSRAIGIPGNLEGAGAALGLAVQKNKEGHKHMLKVCRPRKPTKNDASTRHLSPEDLQKVVDYCVRDVDTEVALWLQLPELMPKEREFWEMDQRVNLRGFQVDRELVTGALKLIDREAGRLDARVKEITKGKIKSARQRDAVLKYVRKRGIALPNLKGETVKEYLKTPRLVKCPVSLELLQIREAISRSSTAKYKAFEARSRSDGRARDNLIYYGAQRTGRDSGTGLQPQNLFKTILKQEDVEAGIELIRRRDFNAIEALYDKPMDLYASALRSCIISKAGHVLDVGDYATIEVRKLFWLCGEKEGLASLERGEPIYSHMAAEIYDEDGDEIEAAHKAGDKDGSFKRTVGKHTVLGSGFGIGVGGEKFQLTCKKFGVHISIELAQKAVRAYRERFPRVPAFWSNIEKAAVLAMQNPGKAYRCGYVVWRREDKWLTCKLPSGRKLYYFQPELRRLPTLWGDKKVLTYLNVKNGKLYREKTWGGKLTENVVQAAARDLLKENQLALEKKAISLPVLAVHDEIVGERKKGLSSTQEFVSTMSGTPEWAEGMPVKVEGWSAERYRK